MYGKVNGLIGWCTLAISAVTGLPTLAQNEPRPVPPSAPGGAITTAVTSCSAATPGFLPTPEKNPQVLLDKLLVGGTAALPQGVVIQNVTTRPASVGPNESLGYYQSFSLQSTNNVSLSIPDGIILTTGKFVDEQNHRIEQCNDTPYWCEFYSDSSWWNYSNNSDDGDWDIANLFQSVPTPYDGVSVNIQFTADPTIVGLRFKLIFASDEFPFYADTSPFIWNGTRISEPVCAYSWPDAFMAFLDGNPFSFAKGPNNQDLLISVTPGVIKFNNNWSPGENHRLNNGCDANGSNALLSSDFIETDFNSQYDGWSDLIEITTYIPYSPEQHTLKLALTDLKDQYLDSAVFLSSLEFIEGPRAYVFYNDSFFDNDTSFCQALMGVGTCDDDTAIATDKVALRPGQTPSMANYISYSKSINGIMVDIKNLPGTPTASDFEFTNTGRDFTGTTPAASPTSITVRPGAGENGSDRITIIWPDNAIPNTNWLKIKAKASPRTGLAQDEVFYFGIAIGEGLSLTGGLATVNATDEIAARNNGHTVFNRATISDEYDYNRDSLVNSTDELISRNNSMGFTALSLVGSAPP